MPGSECREECWSSAVACAAKEISTASSTLPATPLVPGTVPSSPHSTFFRNSSPAGQPLSGTNGLVRPRQKRQIVSAAHQQSEICAKFSVFHTVFDVKFW